MAGGGGSLSVPEPGPNPAGCWVPGGRCTHVLRSHSPRAVQSPAASSSNLVGAHLTCLPPPPVVEVILQDLKGLVPCPPLLGCILVTCRGMFRLTKHQSDLEVLQAPTGGGLPHGSTTQAV